MCNDYVTRNIRLVWWTMICFCGKSRFRLTRPLHLVNCISSTHCLSISFIILCMWTGQDLAQYSPNDRYTESCFFFFFFCTWLDRVWYSNVLIRMAFDTTHPFKAPFVRVRSPRFLKVRTNLMPFSDNQQCNPIGIIKCDGRWCYMHGILHLLSLSVAMAIMSICVS